MEQEIGNQAWACQSQADLCCSVCFCRYWFTGFWCRGSGANDRDGVDLEMVDVPEPWKAVDFTSQIGLMTAFYKRLQTVPDGLVEVSKLSCQRSYLGIVG